MNPYDPCVANKQMQAHQMTVSWHVDDLKISHKDPKVVDDFIQWVKTTMNREEVTSPTVSKESTSYRSR